MKRIKRKNETPYLIGMDSTFWLDIVWDYLTKNQKIIANKQTREFNKKYKQNQVLTTPDK
jgi:hypothetical protein